MTIDSADPKAQFHEFGTTAHTIRPRSARWLRFKTTSGVAWAKHVRHPGNPARPMLPDENTARSLAMDVIGNLVRVATGK